MKLLATLCVTGMFLIASPGARAGNNCLFDIDSAHQIMKLQGDCTTDSTIFVPQDYTLDGNGHQITAMDPSSGHYTGAVVQNQGNVAHVKNLRITASGLANVCDAGTSRLRGIMFDGASGSITSDEVIGINQGNSGCQEGNAIEVRNAPFDGTHPNTQHVEINNNYVDQYQKTGIVVNGDVFASVTNNYVGSSGLDDFLASNSVQLGFGAAGSVNNNSILGNDWDGPTDFAGTAVLLFEAGDVNVNHNNISGQGTDVGVLAEFSGGINVMNNTITRSPDDGKDDFGVGVWFFENGAKSKAVHNRFAGWIEDLIGADLAQANVCLPAAP